MRVYVLTDWYYYEGEELRGVFTTLDLAMAAVTDKAQYWTRYESPEAGAVEVHGNYTSYGGHKIYVYDLEAS
jgi:hypothetical protein